MRPGSDPAGYINIRTLVAARHLKVVDTFIIDKAFEEFCRNCGKDGGRQLNVPLMKPQILEWLVKEYGIILPLQL